MQISSNFTLSQMNLWGIIRNVGGNWNLFKWMSIKATKRVINFQEMWEERWMRCCCRSTISASIEAIHWRQTSAMNERAVGAKDPLVAQWMSGHFHADRAAKHCKSAEDRAWVRCLSFSAGDALPEESSVLAQRRMVCRRALVSLFPMNEWSRGTAAGAAVFWSFWQPTTANRRARRWMAGRPYRVSSDHN